MSKEEIIKKMKSVMPWVLNKVIEPYIYEAMELYATEVAKRSLEKAAEMAKVINWWDSENGIREYMSKVSKQSITDESNILL